jgi:hypothetical protein
MAEATGKKRQCYVADENRFDLNSLVLSCFLKLFKEAIEPEISGSIENRVADRRCLTANG